MSPDSYPIKFCSAADGARLAYARSGNGPALVKSANWMTHLELDRKSVLWRHWFEELAVGRSFTCYDGRGYGMSDRNPPKLDLDAMVDDLRAVADASRLERFPLIGFCHGGPIAMAFAARYPERVSALVLSGTYVKGRAKRDASERDRAERDLLLRMIDVGWGQDNPAFRQVFASKAIPGASAEIFSAFNALQRASATPAAAKRLTEFFWNIDVAETALQVRCPTLVLHAVGDAVVPFEQGQQVAELVPGATLVTLESENHDLLGDEPAWPQFVREVRNFTDEHDGPAQPTLTPLDALTRRENDVLELIAQGLDNDEIAAALHLSEKTVRNHITRVFSKMDVASRSRAIVRARESGYGRGRTPNQRD